MVRIFATLAALALATLAGGCAIIDPDGVKSRAQANIAGYFRSDDYPSAAIRRGEEGTVRARLAVDANGEVTTCEVISSSGSEALDFATCKILVARAKFTPAYNNRGEPIADIVDTPPIRWQNLEYGDDYGTTWREDLNFGVQLFVDYGKNGRVNACKAAPVSGDVEMTCGAFYKNAHEIFRRFAKRIGNLEKGVVHWEHATLPYDEAKVRLATLSEGAEVLDELRFLIVFDDDGTLRDCVPESQSRELAGEEKDVCPNVESGFFKLPCAQEQNGCSGHWLHYHHLDRHDEDPERWFSDGQKSPSPMRDNRRP